MERTVYEMKIFALGAAVCKLRRRAHLYEMTLLELLETATPAVRERIKLVLPT